ncbi:MAG: hypothetical protein WBN85_00560 [Candidatus Macondimonas sp.]
MKSHIVLMCAVAMAAGSLPASAGMTDLADSSLRDVSGQAYTLNVGMNSYAAPFAYEVFSSKAPAPVVATGQNLVATWAPGYPAKVGAARGFGLSKANMGLTAVTTSLQAIPYFGSLVPAVSITSP